MKDEINKILSGEVQNQLPKKLEKDTNEEEQIKIYIWTKTTSFLTIMQKIRDR